MSRIYSTRLGAVSTTAAGNQVLVSTPSGYVDVVRCLDGLCQGPGALFFYISVGGTNTTFLLWSCTTAPENFSWRGHLVLNPGDMLIFYSTGGTWSVQASGYRLTV